MRRTEKWGWFRLGGFRKDPFLTQEDKRYYEKRLKEKKDLFPSERREKKFWLREEEKEHKRVEEMIRKKDEKALGKWLKIFGKSDKGLWFPTHNKIKKDEWL